MRTRLFYFIAFVLLFTGCGKQLDEFVNSGAKHPIIPIPVIEPPNFSTASSKAMKYSPGSNLTSGSQVAGRFSLTPTHFATTGTQGQVNTVLSINRSRSQ